MAKIVKDSGSEEWFKPTWRRNTFPILRQPARTIDDVIGAAFLLQYLRVPYVQDKSVQITNVFKILMDTIGQNQ